MSHELKGGIDLEEVEVSVRDSVDKFGQLRPVRLTCRHLGSATPEAVSKARQHTTVTEEPFQSGACTKCLVSRKLWRWSERRGGGGLAELEAVRAAAHGDEVLLANPCTALLQVTRSLYC